MSDSINRGHFEWFTGYDDDKVYTFHLQRNDHPNFKGQFFNIIMFLLIQTVEINQLKLYIEQRSIKKEKLIFHR